MKWVIDLLTSSIGKKLIMSLTGVFLVSFLIVHLLGNFQLLAGDQGESFNIYAHFMTTNPLIKFISIGLYAMIVMHAALGLALFSKNRAASGGKYAVASKNKEVSWESKNMAYLGLLVLAFILIHMGDFWYKMKFTDELPLRDYAGMDTSVKDLYLPVRESFSQLWIVVVYIIGLIALALHLKHGWTSAFQTVGWNHKKYNPLIRGIGWIIAYLIPLGFAIIPLWMYYQSQVG